MTNNIQFNCHVSTVLKLDGDDQKKAHLSVGASSEVSLKVTEADITNLTASIRSPSGLEEPCILKRLANGHLGLLVLPYDFILCCLFSFNKAMSNYSFDTDSI